MKNENKKLTVKQIKVAVLRNGAFGGLTTAETAKEMNISGQAVNDLLRRAKQNQPQGFPLLTVREADVLDLLNMGWSNDSIGEKMDLPDYTISKTIKALQDKGAGIADSSPVEIVQYENFFDSQYENSLDCQIVRVF